MLSYIATMDNSRAIKEICKQQSILILHELQEYIDLDKFIKETKINYNLLKFLVIDLECISNTDDEVISILYNFNKLYRKIRIILIVPNYDSRLGFLDKLIQNGFYNFIIINGQNKIESELLKCLSQEGKTMKDVQHFEVIEEIKEKSHYFKNLQIKIKEKLRRGDKERKVKQIKKPMEESRRNAPTQRCLFF